MKLGICQLRTTKDKNKNIINTLSKIYNLAEQNCDLIILPECFNSPYGLKYFREYSENINDKNSPTINLFYTISKELPNIYFFFGSIPEKDNENIYNTCFVFYNGELINKYRKMHLYDIYIDEKINFQESKEITPGNSPTIIDTKFGKIGLGICYDLRFPKLAEYYRKQGCFMIIYPGAFNMKTGQDHWELLQKSRALDNMLFIASCSTARKLPNIKGEEDMYESWGHSTVVDPWGTVISKLDEKENTMVVEININEIQNVRKKIPVLSNEINIF